MTKVNNNNYTGKNIYLRHWVSTVFWLGPVIYDLWLREEKQEVIMDQETS